MLKFSKLLHLWFLGFSESPSWFMDDILLCPQIMEGVGQFFGVSLIKAQAPSMRASSLWSNYHPQTVTLDIRISAVCFEGHKHSLLSNSLSECPLGPPSPVEPLSLVWVILKIVRTTTFQKGPVLVSSFRRDSSSPHRNKAISCVASVWSWCDVPPVHSTSWVSVFALRLLPCLPLELFTMCMSIRNILSFLSCRVKMHTV